MKKLTIAISSVLLSTSVFAADVAQPTKDTPAKVDVAKTDTSGIDMAKVSYLLGRDMGSQLKKSNISIDQTNFDKGLSSALQNKPSDISDADTKTIMMSFQQEMMAKMKQKEIVVADINKSDSSNFEVAVAKVDGVKKVADGVYVQTLKAGDGAQPTKADSVTVNYRGTTPSKDFALNSTESLRTIKEGNLIGPEFDSSYNRGEPATFPLTGVVKCWQEAIPQLKVGSKAIIYCAPDTAYGKNAPASIGPDQLLSFQVELLKIDTKK